MRTSLILLFVASAITFSSAQILHYQDGKFFYDSQVFDLEDIPLHLDLSTVEQVQYFYLLSSKERIRSRRNIALTTTAVTGGVLLLSVPYGNEPSIETFFFAPIFALTTIIGIPAILITTYSWMSSKSAYANKLKTFVDFHNEEVLKQPEYNYNIKLSPMGMGVVMNF